MTKKDNQEKKKICLNLNKVLIQKLKHRALEKEITMTAIVEELIEKSLHTTRGSS